MSWHWSLHAACRVRDSVVRYARASSSRTSRSIKVLFRERTPVSCEQALHSKAFYDLNRLHSPVSQLIT